MFFALSAVFMAAMRIYIPVPGELQSEPASLEPAEAILEIDHTPFIKMSIEITRMKKRLVKSEFKDRKHLEKALERIEEFFKEKGYYIIDYEGVSYDEGMNLIAHFVPSETLNPDEKIITKVIIPQVNFQNILIHPAEVEVSFGE